MTMRYASFKDKLFFGFGVFGMIGYGVSRPLFAIMYGKVTGGATRTESKIGSADSNIW
jgi:hypothetical protein